jgi:hypothetical protein
MCADSPRTNLRKSYAFDQYTLILILLRVWRNRNKYRKILVSVNSHKTFMATPQPLISQQYNLNTEDALSLLGFRINWVITYYFCRSQWPLGLKAWVCGRSWVRIPPVAWTFVFCACYVLSGRGLCDELITRAEESYRLWCVVVCDLETSCMRRPWPTGGCCAKNEKKLLIFLS